MIVVADTSVVRNLARVGRVDLLHQLYEQVWIPPTVVVEFIRQTATNPRFRGLQLPEWIRRKAPAAILISVQSYPALDAGEIEAISLALAIGANAVLVDEEAGRSAALSHGLRTFGALGVLLQAKAAGHLPQVTPVLDALRRDAGFWCSEALRSRVLQEAGEQSG